MKELQKTMLSKLRSIRDEVVVAGDIDRQKSLLNNAWQDLPQDIEGNYATNIPELLTCFMETNQYDIDSMIGFLENELQRDFDTVTMQREEEEDFDGIYGTRTSLIISQFEMPENISIDRLFNSSRFHPSPVLTVQFALEMLEEFGIRYEDFVFIDIGTGTGRNLLLASAYPFKRMIGVEISTFLCDIARENIRSYDAFNGKPCGAELYCQDILEFSLPDNDLVLYFWEPFKDKVANPFIEKIEELIREKKRRVVLIFLQLAYQRVIDSGFFLCKGKYEAPDITDSQGDHFMISVYDTAHE
jgi:hypothetical protein